MYSGSSYTGAHGVGAVGVDGFVCARNCPAARPTRRADAELRFKLLLRKRGTDMQGQEGAQVIPNRRALSMTWRTDIRTPGLPTDTRRLGDLRLECKVGMEAGLISNYSSLLGRLASAALDTPAYCDKTDPQYLFFADRPLFSVALVSGHRREMLAIDKLYAAASDDPGHRLRAFHCACA